MSLVRITYCPALTMTCTSFSLGLFVVSLSSMSCSGGESGELSYENASGGSLLDDEVAVPAGGLASFAEGAGGTVDSGEQSDGTGGAIDEGAPTLDASFAALKYVIDYTQPTCVAAPCHGNRGTNISLRDDGTLYQNLLSHISVACGNRRVVEPGKPEESALVMLLKGACGETPRMPSGCIQNEFENNCVPDEQIAKIEEWIAKGAPEN